MGCGGALELRRKVWIYGGRGGGCAWISGDQQWASRRREWISSAGAAGTRGSPAVVHVRLPPSLFGPRRPAVGVAASRGGWQHEGLRRGVAGWIQRHFQNNHHRQYPITAELQMMDLKPAVKGGLEPAVMGFCGAVGVQFEHLVLRR